LQNDEEETDDNEEETDDEDDAMSVSMAREYAYKNLTDSRSHANHDNAIAIGHSGCEDSFTVTDLNSVVNLRGLAKATMMNLKERRDNKTRDQAAAATASALEDGSKAQEVNKSGRMTMATGIMNINNSNDATLLPSKQKQELTTSKLDHHPRKGHNHEGEISGDISITDLSSLADIQFLAKATMFNLGRTSTASSSKDITKKELETTKHVSSQGNKKEIFTTKQTAASPSSRNKPTKTSPPAKTKTTKSCKEEEDAVTTRTKEESSPTKPSKTKTSKSGEDAAAPKRREETSPTKPPHKASPKAKHHEEAASDKKESPSSSMKRNKSPSQNRKTRTSASADKNKGSSNYRRAKSLVVPTTISTSTTTTTTKSPSAAGPSLRRSRTFTGTATTSNTETTTTTSTQGATPTTISRIRRPSSGSARRAGSRHRSLVGNAQLKQLGRTLQQPNVMMKDLDEEEYGNNGDWDQEAPSNDRNDTKRDKEGNGEKNEKNDEPLDDGDDQVKASSSPLPIEENVRIASFMTIGPGTDLNKVDFASLDTDTVHGLLEQYAAKQKSLWLATVDSANDGTPKNSGTTADDDDDSSSACESMVLENMDPCPSTTSDLKLPDRQRPRRSSLGNTSERHAVMAGDLNNSIVLPMVGKCKRPQHTKSKPSRQQRRNSLPSKNGHPASIDDDSSRSTWSVTVHPTVTTYAGTSGNLFDDLDDSDSDWGDDDDDVFAC